MSVVIERTVTVPAGATAVLDHLRDFGATARWDPGTRAVARTGAGPIVVGARWHHTTSVLGATAELTCTLVESTPDRLVFVDRTEGATATLRITVAPAGDGTRVTYHLDLDLHGLAKLTAPLLRTELERRATEAVTGLAGVLAQAATPSGPEPPRTPRGS